MERIAYANAYFPVRQMRENMLEIYADSSDSGSLRLIPSDRRDQSFKLWFPEIIWRQTDQQQHLSDGKRSFDDAFRDYALYWKGADSWKSTQWEAIPGPGVQRLIEFELGAVCTKVTVCPEGVDLELRIRNKSKELWIACYAEVCLQLADAPDFADITRERTYGRVSGNWRALSSTPVSRPDPQHNAYHSSLKNPFYWESIRGWWTEEIQVVLDHPVIFVQSRTNDGLIAISFDPCIGYCNNLKPDMACIHSDPFLGCIPSGKESCAVGHVLYGHDTASTFYRWTG
jgi:hypothetical protein